MILLVGNFPPPVHGMSVINQALYDRLRSETIVVKKLDTSPQTLDRDIFSRLSRVKKVFLVWKRILFAHRDDVLYIALSGGVGQVYDIVSVGLARLKGLRCFLHHHSFAYLNKKFSLTSLLFGFAGKKATNIVLSDGMGQTLRHQYGVHNVVQLSNLAFPATMHDYRSARPLRKVGYISNITKEKGGDTLIDLAYEIKKNKLPIDFMIAGPCPEDDLLQKISRSEKEGALKWQGGVYGKEKELFYKELDVFIFPTQYKNEAEPLVIWEALASGIPVISYNRGCIPEQLGNAGVLVDPKDDFISLAVTTLSRWCLDEGEYQEYVRRASAQYDDMVEKANAQWKKLTNILCEQTHL